MSKTQATFGEIEPPATTTDADATPGAQLETTAGVEPGDRVTLDHPVHDPGKMYQVVEVTAGSLTIERDGSTTTLQDKRDGWVIRGSRFTVTPWYVGSGAVGVACCACGDHLDPADAGRRDGDEYECRDCLGVSA